MKTAVTLAARAHDKTPTHSYRSPPARTPAHAILPLLPLSVLSSLKPDTIKPISQDAVYRALTLFHNCVNSNLSFLSGIYIHQKEHQAIPFQTVQVPYPN
jgi:hypothetical protein